MQAGSGALLQRSRSSLADERSLCCFSRRTGILGAPCPTIPNDWCIKHTPWVSRRSAMAAPCVAACSAPNVCSIMPCCHLCYGVLAMGKFASLDSSISRGQSTGFLANAAQPGRGRFYDATEKFHLRGYQRQKELIVPIQCIQGNAVSDVSKPSNAVQESPEFKNFLDSTKKGNLVPVFHRIFSDHLTPVLAYRCLVKEDDRDAPSFLFESVESGERGSNVGRFSMVGAQPAMEIVAKEDFVTVLDHEEGSRVERVMNDPMTIVSVFASKWKPVAVDGLPDIFCGGWVGYFSYDTVRYVERKKLPFTKAPDDDRGLPDIHLGLYNDVVVFDHVSKTVYAVHWVHIDRYHLIEEAFKDGQKRLETLVSRLQNVDPPRLSSGSVDLSIEHHGSIMKHSNMTKEAYKDAILKSKEHILAGDIFQIVLSQRFERRTFADPFEIYRALRVVNPSPYMIYLQARGCILVASSPEILMRIKKGKIINRPLAGTRRRGNTQEEDQLLQAELLKDEKECAEHIMLVDLGRNDVGKVSKAGSVNVEKLMEVERYSHVMHISSTVTGRLLDHLSGWDALRAALPVGTVSGAPKVRAMELIDELEPTRRGPYSGGIGGVSFTGDMDIALALRTMVFPTCARYDTMYSYGKNSHRHEWVVHLQAGAGIVADSDPDDEYSECINKAAGLGRAIDLAESAFCKDLGEQ